MSDLEADLRADALLHGGRDPEVVELELRGREGDDAAIIRLAEEHGFIIHKPLPPVREITVADTSRIRGDRVRLAVIADTHFGSKYQQVTLLRQFLLYARKRKVNEVLHLGDTGDGPFKRHHNPQEVWLHTFPAMVEYASSEEAIPEIGVPYFFIDGNHDDWWSDDGGPVFGEAVCARRDDFHYLGSPSALRRYGDVVVELFHPNEGGAYALSYKLQKHIEQMSPEDKPNIHLAGNYHKACHLPAYRNVEGFLVPAYMSRSHWMRGKSLGSVVGGLILEFGICTDGLTPSLNIEWIIERIPLVNDWPGR